MYYGCEIIWRRSTILDSRFYFGKCLRTHCSLVNGPFGCRMLDSNRSNRTLRPNSVIFRSIDTHFSFAHSVGEFSFNNLNCHFKNRENGHALTFELILQDSRKYWTVLVAVSCGLPEHLNLAGFQVAYEYGQLALP